MRILLVIILNKTIISKILNRKDYVHICRTIRECDEDIVFDGPSNISSFSNYNEISGILVEGMCFSTKISLQFVDSGWSIHNNVQFVTVISN